MTLVNIDLTNAGYETGPDDRVVFYSPANRNEQGTIISTAEASVPLVDGQASKELAPGPVVVQILAQGVADTRQKSGYVPDLADPVSLWDVVLDWTPPLVDQGILAILVAVENAVGRVAGAVAAEVDAIKWNRGNVPADTDSFANLAPGIWGVPSGGLATQIGMPEPKLGSLTISHSSQSNFATFLTNTHAGGRSNLWVASTDNFGSTWSPWEKVLNSDDRWDRRRPNPAWTISDYPVGQWSIFSGAALSSLGLPSQSLGSLEVLDVGGTGLPSTSKVARFTTISHSTNRPRTLLRATDNLGVWEPTWHEAFPDPATSGVTRRAAVPLTFPRGGTYRDSRPDVTVRIPFKLGAGIKKARARLRNYDYRDDTQLTSSFTVVGVAIGEHQINADGAMTGYIKEGTVPVVLGTGIATSTGEVITPWVDVNLKPGVDYVLSYSITAPAGVEWSYQTTRGFTNTMRGAWSAVGVTTSLHHKMVPLSAILDVEVAAETPVYAYFGDSQTAAISAEHPGYDSWAMVHSRMKGAIPTIIAHPGGSLREWLDASKPGFNIFAEFGKTDLFFCSMGYNDIGNGRTVTAIKEYLNTVLDNWRPKTGAFIVHNYLPKWGTDDIAVRKELNEWIVAMLPGRSMMAIDIFSATAAADNNIDPRWAASSSDSHLNSPGNARIAQATLGGLIS